MLLNAGLYSSGVRKLRMDGAITNRYIKPKNFAMEKYPPV
jgi:hypothetical protein